LKRTGMSFTSITMHQCINAGESPRHETNSQVESHKSYVYTRALGVHR